MLGHLRQFLPHILVAAALISIFAASYTSVAYSVSSGPKSLWTTNPVTITFSGAGGTSSSGSVGDSFKCAPPVTSAVTLESSVSITNGGNSKVSLTANPSNFAACGPPFSAVTLTAHCLVAAPNCKGTYTGTVEIHPSPYQKIVPDLSVSIIVTA